MAPYSIVSAGSYRLVPVAEQMAVPEGGNGYVISDFCAPYTHSDSAPHVSGGNGKIGTVRAATFPGMMLPFLRGRHRVIARCW